MTNPSRPVVRISDLSENKENERGLKCRECGCCNFSVYRTRNGSGFVYRERHCRNCGAKLNTREIPLD